MDEVKLTLLSLENEVNALDDNITRNIRKELEFLRRDLENLEDYINDLKDAWEFLRRDLENLEDYINDLKDAWELIDNDYEQLEDAIGRF